MLKYKCGAAGAARAVRARSGGASPAARHVATSYTPPLYSPPDPHPSPQTTHAEIGDARVDVAKAAAKVAKAAAKVGKVAGPPTGASHPMVGGSPRRKQPSEAADHRSAAVGGLQAKVARAARDIAGELGWRRARLRHGVRSPGRLSPQRQRRQKCARGAGEASRGTREGVRLSAWRVGGRLPCARAGRPAASEARVVDP